MPLKYRDLVKLVEADGWQLDHQTGSHLQFRHPDKPGTVTISAGGKMGKDVPIGTEKSVRKQAGIE